MLYAANVSIYVMWAAALPLQQQTYRTVYTAYMCWTTCGGEVAGPEDALGGDVHCKVSSSEKCLPSNRRWGVVHSFTLPHQGVLGFRCM